VLWQTTSGGELARHEANTRHPRLSLAPRARTRRDSASRSAETGTGGLAAAWYGALTAAGYGLITVTVRASRVEEPISVDIGAPLTALEGGLA